MQQTHTHKGVAGVLKPKNYSLVEGNQTKVLCNIVSGKRESALATIPMWSPAHVQGVALVKKSKKKRKIFLLYSSFCIVLDLCSQVL